MDGPLCNGQFLHKISSDELSCVWQLKTTGMYDLHDIQRETTKGEKVLTGVRRGENG